MAKMHAFSYQQIAKALQDKDLLREGPITSIRVSSPRGTKELAADLPWALPRYQWMLPFLLCLERHGKEDCMCWKGKESKAARAGSAYIGWRKAEHQLLLSNATFAEPWMREKKLALDRFKARALEAWRKAHPGEPIPRLSELTPMADASIPWAKDLLESVKKGRTPSGAAKVLGKSRYAVTSARRRHPWLDARLTELGYPGREWRAPFTPARRTK